MNRALLASLLAGMILVACGCKPKADDKEAIRAGVVNYLTSVRRLNLPNMEIIVTQATVNGNQATAQVEIKAKNGGPEAGSMQLKYTLEKRANEWIVLKSTPAGGTIPHPGPGQLPPTGAMPPGHPSVNGSSDQPVHSDFNDIIKPSQPAQQLPPPPLQKP